MQRECPFCQSKVPKIATSCVICGHDLPKEESMPVIDAPSVVSDFPTPPAPATLSTAPDELINEPESMLDESFFADTTPDMSNPYYRALLHAIDASFEGSEATEELVGPSPQGAIEVVEPTAADPPVETDLGAMVGVYAVIGGYSGALIGLFAPIIVILGLSFQSEGIGEWIISILLYVILGAIIWIPTSVVLAVIVGIGGLLLGLGVGIVAAVLLRLAVGNTESYKAVQGLVGVLNAAVFGYAAYWTYTNSFLYRTFDELTALPVVFGLLGGISGLVMALIDPGKSEDSEPLTDQDREAAKQMFTAPFRLWGAMAGRSLDVIAGDSSSSYDDKEAKQYEKDLKRITKEQQMMERKMKQQDRELENHQRKMQRELDEQLRWGRTELYKQQMRRRK